MEDTIFLFMDSNEAQQYAEKKQTLTQIVDTIQKEVNPSRIQKRKKIDNNNSKNHIQLASDKQSSNSSTGTLKSKNWSQNETRLFFKLMQKYGTDFSMIKQFFPKKSKAQIKQKYKEEQMSNFKKQKNEKLIELKIKNEDEKMERQIEQILKRIGQT